MQEILQQFLPSHLLSSGSALFSFLLFIFIVGQILFNLYRTRKDRQAELKNAAVFEEKLRASEKRIRDLMLQMQKNRQMMLDQLHTVRDIANDVVTADEFAERQDEFKNKKNTQPNSKPNDTPKK